MKRIIFFITVWIGVCLSGTGQISRDITLKQSDLKVVNTEEFDRISFLDNVHYTDIVGRPELPVYIKSFVVPIDAQN